MPGVKKSGGRARQGKPKKAPPRSTGKAKKRTSGGAKAPPKERTIVRIRTLDPYRKCGPGTSVERLIRVDELVDRKLEAHLVFLDRHGWYCEHGRTCHAVGHARKHRG